MNSEILKNRTKMFAIDVARFCEDLPPRFSILSYSRQLIRISSSVGANYRAACRAKSTADFINKLKIVEEEADESVYFLELIDELENSKKESITKLKKEGNELLAITLAPINTARQRKSPNRKS